MHEGVFVQTIPRASRERFRHMAMMLGHEVRANHGWPRQPPRVCGIITCLVVTLDLGIRSFEGHAIKPLHGRNDARGVDPAHVRRLQAILAALDGPDVRAVRYENYHH